jgi:hypothetical protein
MSLSLLISQSRLSLPVHHMIWGAWTASHSGGLAWLFSAWLAQILLLIKVPDSYKSHRYNITAKTTQSTAQQLYTRTFLLFSIFHTGELKRPVRPKSLCRAHHCYKFVVPTYSWYCTYCEFTAVRWTDINCLNTWVIARKVPSQPRRESNWSQRAR